MSVSSSHGQSLNVPSPNGKLLAGVVQGSRVIVRLVPSLAVHGIYSAVDRVESVAWNATGSLLLGVVLSQGVVHVWSMQDPDWVCRIDAGSEGLNTAYFHPRHPRLMFTVSDFDLRVQLWSFDGLLMCFTNVQALPKPSHDHSLAALIVGTESGSQIIVGDISGPSGFDIVAAPHLNRSFGKCELIATLERGRFVVMESRGSEKCMYLIDTLRGVGMKECQLSPLEGRVCESSGGVLAIGCADESVELFVIRSGLESLGSISIKCPTVTIVNGHPIILRESLGADASVKDRNLFHLGGANTRGLPVAYRELVPDEGPIRSLGRIQIPSTESTSRHPSNLPIGGVCKLRMSMNGEWLAIQTDEKASVVFVIHIPKLMVVSILVHRQPVRDFDWSISEGSVQLGVVSGDPWLHVWRPYLNCVTVPMKDLSMRPHQLQWTKTGQQAILSDNQCVCCVSIEGGVNEHGG